MLRLIDIGLSALYLYGADTVKSSLLSIIYKLVENLLAWSIYKWVLGYIYRKYRRVRNITIYGHIL